MKFKHARTISELQSDNRDYEELYKSKPYLQIFEWNVSDLSANMAKIGLEGSPTKVKKIENVVLTAKETVKLSNNDKDIEFLIKDLISNHTIG